MERRKQMQQTIPTISLTDTVTETEKSIEDIHEYNFCRRCGRKLTNTENRLRGMGPICWERSHIEYRRRLFDADSNT